MPGSVTAPSLSTVTTLSVVVAPAAVGVIEVVPNAVVVFAGLPLTVRATGAENPPIDVAVTIYFAVPPGATTEDPLDAGVSDMVYDGGIATTSVALAVCVIVPPTAVTVMVLLPVGVTCREIDAVDGLASFVPATITPSSSESEVAIASVAVAPLAVGVNAPNVAVAPVGSPDAERVIGELKPPVSVIVTL
jgi:hypothetical protein